MNTFFQAVSVALYGSGLVVMILLTFHVRSIEYRVDIIGRYWPPGVIIYFLLLLFSGLFIHVLLLLIFRLKEKTIEVEAYERVRSKKESERLPLIQHPNGVQIRDLNLEVTSHCRRCFISHFRIHNNFVIACLLLVLLIVLISLCYYLPILNPTTTHTPLPYQMLAWNNASASIQIVWRNIKQYDSKLMLFNGSGIPTENDIRNSSLWEERTPLLIADHWVLVLEDLNFSIPLFYYIPSYTGTDIIRRIVLPSPDEDVQLLLAGNFGTSPYINSVLLSRISSFQPIVVLLLGNFTSEAFEPKNWELLMRRDGIFDYLADHPFMVSPGLIESVPRWVSSEAPRTIFNGAFPQPQVLRRMRGGSTEGGARNRTDLSSCFSSSSFSLIPSDLAQYYEEDFPSLSDQRYYYSHTISHVFVTVVDSHDNDKRNIAYDLPRGSLLSLEQLTWLNLTLSSPTAQQARYRVLIMSTPLYSTSNILGNEWAEKLLIPLICRYKIDLVLASVSSVYERFHYDDLCQEHGSSHAFHHLSIGSAGKWPVPMTSLFYRRYRWPDLAYRDALPGCETDSCKAHVYGRVGYHYITLTATTERLIVQTHDIVNDEVVDAFTINSRQ
ncbi:hypothetical protein GMRT_14502 [Giardia muris]|uniref:Calcineurin-like phosphoesterase domain-containing protein n=1 Tax=Giardia muris TaxID=5742 RepID=A0A4Z1T9S6_GIAMU|nr:hypothetical protein GMRT_14502 [Giardia muris]|eukprot:TNJ29259.1 hypothetical protein GMRT_14502 [Giardia muris]